MESTQCQTLGKEILSKSKIVICSIVRDCAKSLKNNIKTIDSLCDLAYDYSVIIFENDSKDDTKQVLSNWAKQRDKVYVDIKDIKAVNSIPNPKMTTANPFYSNLRIQRMADYRNQYLEYIEKMNITGDYLIVVDLDVINIHLEGIIDSFSQEIEWDAISANGYSISPRLTKRYHDTYALVEIGKENIPQTENSIKENQYRYSFLKKGIPMIKVYSAFGGLCIYRFEITKGLRYSILPNNDTRVEVRCEHFGFNSQIHHRGFNKFFINPSMEIKYQKLSFSLVFQTIYNKLRKIYFGVVLRNRKPNLHSSI